MEPADQGQAIRGERDEDSKSGRGERQRDEEAKRDRSSIQKILDPLSFKHPSEWMETDSFTHGPVTDSKPQQQAPLCMIPLVLTMYSGILFFSISQYQTMVEEIM
ncbi:hypothetical protein STEG23_006526 [Scotinomys teguina]